MILKDDDLQIVKSIELNIVKEIKRICDRHDIQYSMNGGTLIGAVRHQGFIPWDDDIDLIMIRKEYDKFLHFAKYELDKQYYLANYHETPKMGEPFTKVMMKNTVMQEKFTGQSGAPNGVFVDVFPFDITPENSALRLIQRFNNYLLRKKILIKSGYDFQKTGLKSILYNVIAATTVATKSSLIDKYEANQVKYDSTSSKWATCLCGQYGYEKETIPYEWFDKYVELPFEDITLKAVSNYDKLLRHYFGNYMQLPPIDQRINKHTVKSIDLTAFGGRKASE